MRDRIFIAGSQWAIDLYNEAKSLYSIVPSFPNGFLTDPSGNNYASWTHGRPMMAMAVAYSIDGNSTWAERALEWMRLWTAYQGIPGNFWNPDPTVTTTNNSDFTHFFTIWVICFDLLYEYMSVNQPALLASEFMPYCRYLAVKEPIVFGHNQSHPRACVAGIAALASGRGSIINEVWTDWTTWYNSTTYCPEGVHYEAQGQARKHWEFVSQGQFHLLIAMKRAFDLGYIQVNPLTYISPSGYNIIKDNWDVMFYRCTPRGQVAYESMWRGLTFSEAENSQLYTLLHAATGDDSYKSLQVENPTRRLRVSIDNRSAFVPTNYWAGLTHGSDFSPSSPPLKKNVHVFKASRGFIAFGAGAPDGFLTRDSLHLNGVFGDYGTSLNQFNVRFYGKGERLVEAEMTLPDDTAGERGGGGSYVSPLLTQVTTAATFPLKDINGANFKIFTAQERDARTVAMTNEYFFDIFDTQTNRTDPTYVHDGIGLTATNYAVTAAGNKSLTSDTVINGDFKVIYPNHQVLHIINDGASTCKFQTKLNTPNLVRNAYDSDPICTLTVKRNGVGIKTRFIHIIEPLAIGGASIISAYRRFASGFPILTTAVKITGPAWVDYIVYAHTPGDYTLTDGAETISISGRYGYIRKTATTQTVQGDVTSFTVDPVSGGGGGGGGETPTYIQPPPIGEMITF